VTSSPDLSGASRAEEVKFRALVNDLQTLRRRWDE
jgi:hypothetical protein